MSINRRSFLQTAALGVAGGMASPVLVACSGESSNGTAGSTSQGAVGFQLSWLKSVEWAGTWFAQEQGYYKKQGLDVTVSAGGPQVSVEPRLAAGRCLIGMTYGVGAATANKNGAKIKIIGNQFQKSPTVFASPADAPLRTPDQLKGKKLGVNTTALPVAKQFLATNGIAEKDVTIVPVQSSSDPLVNGQVDAQLGYVTDTATLDLKGYQTAKLFFSDYGYGDVTNAYGVTEETLDSHRDEVIRFMTAEIRGWQDFVADPNLGAQLTVDKYATGAGLKLDEQRLVAKHTTELAAQGATKGLMWISDATKELVLKAVKGAGAPTTTEDLFDDSVLTDVYKGRTKL